MKRTFFLPKKTWTDEVVGQFFNRALDDFVTIFVGDSCLHSKKTPTKKYTVIFRVGRSMPRDDQKMLNFSCFQ